MLINLLSRSPLCVSSFLSILVVNYGGFYSAPIFRLLGLFEFCCVVGKLPASQASPAVVSAFRSVEREQTMKLLDKYLTVCRAARASLFFLFSF